MDNAEGHEKVTGILFSIHHLDEAKGEVSSKALQLWRGENKVTTVPGIESWAFFWLVFSLYYHCLPFPASQREDPFSFPITQ